MDLFTAPCFLRWTTAAFPSDHGCRGLLPSSAPRLHCRGFRSLLRLHDVFIVALPPMAGGATVRLQLSLMDGFRQYFPLNLPSLAVLEDPHSAFSSMAMLSFFLLQLRRRALVAT